MSGELFTEEEHKGCIEYYQKLLVEKKLNINEWSNGMYRKHGRWRRPHSYKNCLQNISALRKDRDFPIIETLSPRWDHYNRNQLVRLAEEFWDMNKSVDEH